MIYDWVSVMVYEIDDTNHFHIVPAGDLRDHEADPSCWCLPVEDDDDPGIWVHHAMDRREDRERDRMRY